MTRADEPSDVTYSVRPGVPRPGTLCDWCDHLAVAIVTNQYADLDRPSRDWMCSQHLAEYHPTLTINS